MIIGGRRYREAAKAQGIHFYADHHLLPKLQITTLSLVEIISNGKGRGWKIYFGSLLWWGEGDSLFRHWEQARRPSSPALISGLVELAEALPNTRRKKWLAQAPGRHTYLRLKK